MIDIKLTKQIESCKTSTRLFIEKIPIILHYYKLMKWYGRKAPHALYIEE